MSKRKITPDEGRRALLAFVDVACGVLDGFEAMEKGSSLLVAANIAYKKTRKRMKRSGILPSKKPKPAAPDPNVIDVEGKLV